MGLYVGKVRKGVGQAGRQWGWMDTHICKEMGWSSVAPGTLNVFLPKYRDYGIVRRVDFLIPHFLCPRTDLGPLGSWDCYFQRCAIDWDSDKLDAVIATTGDNWWGRTAQVIEIMAPENLSAKMGLIEDSIITIDV